MATATISLGSRRYPVLGPSLRDSRLHLASVIISIHVLGQLAYGFRVSVPQILVAIFTCAVIEVIWTIRQTGVIAWPASAMLTGSGVALILRLTGMERGDHWSWRGWYLFALVAAGSLLSKYLLRRAGTHLFNPSNIGLVVAFLLLGSDVIEPLDFWWAPWGPAMAAGYVIILGGGLVITARLGLFGLAAAFWATLAAALGLLAASGHCMTAAWSLRPVCGQDFWRILVTSPEILIFLFFMITDPRTIPTRRAARILFGVVVGIVSALLIAPQATEFGAKVGLLSGLVLVTPFRLHFDRFGAVDWLAVRSGSWAGPTRLVARGATLGAALGLLGVATVLAGLPARQATATPLTTTAVAIPSSELPKVTVAAEVAALQGDLAQHPDQMALALTRALRVVSQAMARSDLALARTVADGRFLVSLDGRITEATARGEAIADEYHLDRIHVGVTYAAGPQGGADLAITAWGTVDEVRYDGAGTETSRAERPLYRTFVLRPGASESWVILSESAPADG